LASEHKKEIAEGTYDIDMGLATGWSALDEPTKRDFLQRFEFLKKQLEVEKEVGSSGPRQTVFDAAPSHADEDVEMAEDATDAGTPSVAGESGGFTAVNRA
jgi:non-histone protein 10